jgi:long-chain acyl-CoA synthetase
VEKIWLEAYQEGVPADVDINEFTSIIDVFEKACTQYKDSPAYSNMGVTLTYGEIDEQSRSFGAYLQKVVGLKKGDRVAIMLPNVLQYPVALFGILRAGMIAVNVNPLFTPRELEHELRDSGAKAIVILENFAKTLEQVLPTTPVETIITTQIGDLFPFPKSAIVNFVVKHIKKMVPRWSIPKAVNFQSALDAGKSQTLDDVEITHADTAFLQYTGGTTGVAKGAVLTHGNMVANIIQVRAWVVPPLDYGQDIVITALPLYHIFALCVNCLGFTAIGGHNILITNPRDFPNFVKELKKWKFTCITGVNTLFNALLHTPGFDAIDFSALKFSAGGGMQVQRSVAEAWKAATGTPLIEAYGLTETSPAASINPLHYTHHTGAIGVPISSTEMSVQTDEGTLLPHGEVGEICIRGPQVMKGYWNQPEETSKAITKDGWFRSGDIGHMDEKGFFYVEDRKKDMILVSGFNVYPNEIEEVVASHDGILEAAVVGVPDARCGEAVKLYAVKQDPELSADQIIKHCRKNLTAYKIPKHVEFREELPKTNVGKILRRALRDEGQH